MVPFALYSFFRRMWTSRHSWKPVPWRRRTGRPLERPLPPLLLLQAPSHLLHPPARSVVAWATGRRNVGSMLLLARLPKPMLMHRRKGSAKRAKAKPRQLRNRLLTLLLPPQHHHKLRTRLSSLEMQVPHRFHCPLLPDLTGTQTQAPLLT